jgi:hypothetical protein
LLRYQLQKAKAKGRRRGEEGSAALTRRRRQGRCGGLLGCPATMTTLDYDPLALESTGRERYTLIKALPSYKFQIAPWVLHMEHNLYIYIYKEYVETFWKYNFKPW